MPRFLAIDWDHDQLCLVAVTATRSQVRIEQSLAWPEPSAATGIALDAVAERLKLRLKEAKIAPAPLLACIGRERLVYKELRYPPVAAVEEPDVVRFQAIKELNEPVERVVFDYQPWPAQPGQVDRHATVVMARRAEVDAYQRLARALGVKLLSVAPRPHALAALLPSSLTGTNALLVATPRWLELVVVHGGQPVFARALPREAPLSLEVRRNLALVAAQPGMAALLPVQTLHIASDDPQRRADLVEAATLPAQDLPLPTGCSTEFAGAVGLAQLWAARERTPINFVHPRDTKPVRKSSPLFLAGVGGAAVLILVGMVLGMMLLDERRAVADEMENKAAELNRRQEQLQPKIKAHAAIKEWQLTALPLLDELYDLAARFPPRVGMRLTYINVVPIAQRNLKEPFTMRLTLRGVVPRDDRRLVDDLIANIREDAHCRVLREAVKSGGTGDEEGTYQEFTLVVDLAPQERSQYTTYLDVPTTPPPAPTRSSKSKREKAAPPTTAKATEKGEEP